MSGALDMSLDDIIKSSKKTTGGGHGRGHEAGGPSRRVPNRTANRSAPYSSGKVRALRISCGCRIRASYRPPDCSQLGVAARHVLTAQAGGFPAPTARASSIDIDTKLYISNLEFGVSNEDIKPKEEEEAALWSETNGVRPAAFRISIASLS
ncbi:THO complex subunit 4B-like [Zingiber officinale]|uniref:THO complex subunit 4B-like n=1 Tax=Zingiber officinale TaxID=94328 RepID=UPI001C4CE2E4|nr:THO complex subunit 4B-like [Zingiber officinale]